MRLARTQPSGIQGKHGLKILNLYTLPNSVSSLLKVLGNLTLLLQFLQLLSATEYDQLQELNSDESFLTLVQESGKTCIASVCYSSRNFEITKSAKL